MRFWICLHLALWSFTSASAAQVQWTSDQTSSSSTLVDALSADADYTSLIRLFQRARLIPTLNRLNGSTLFAPTNDAIKRHASRNALWHIALEDSVFVIPDNLQEKLRQELLYHLLNYSLSGLPKESELQTHKTLLFPRILADPPTNDPPPLPPWLPAPDGLLGSDPQRVRVTSQDGGFWVGVDAFGGGGAQVVKDKVTADNGILFGISSVLDVPPDLGL